MRRFDYFSFVFSALAAIMCCSCDKSVDCIPFEDAGENGTLDISLVFDESASTRTMTADTTSQAYERQVNSVQIFIFDEDGRVNFYKNAGTTQSNISISTTTGKKTVWAVVNGPDIPTIASLSELEDVAVDLAANSTAASTGFVMTGSAECIVLSTNTTVDISVSRLVARVALQKVVNRLPEGFGTITINSVVLSNVVGNQNLAGDAAATTWYNKMGRKDDATGPDQIIDGLTCKASCEALTFKSVEESLAIGAELHPSVPYLFYSYPNSSTGGSSGWESPFTARESRIVVTATIGGVKYYYPVTLSRKLERNKAYIVEMTITGLGSADPDEPVEKGSFSARVGVHEWVAGESYKEIL